MQRQTKLADAVRNYRRDLETALSQDGALLPELLPLHRQIRELADWACQEIEANAARRVVTADVAARAVRVEHRRMVYARLMRRAVITSLSLGLLVWSAATLGLYALPHSAIVLALQIDIGIGFIPCLLALALSVIT